MSFQETSAFLDANVSGHEQLILFQKAVEDLAATRADLQELIWASETQGYAPTEDQRARIVEARRRNETCSDLVKALSMTLCSNGLLERCSDLVRVHGEGKT